MQGGPALWRSDVTKGWQALADKRLAHLNELFETGRWRRYYTKAAFLENLIEAKSAVETWSMLSGDVAPREQSSTRYREALPGASFVASGVRHPADA